MNKVFKYVISTIIAICLLIPMLITAVGAEGDDTTVDYSELIAQLDRYDEL